VGHCASVLAIPMICSANQPNQIIDMRSLVVQCDVMPRGVHVRI